MCSRCTTLSLWSHNLERRFRFYNCPSKRLFQLHSSSQDVLRCIGGMKTFLPLLEQISYFEPPKPLRIDSSEQLQVFDLEQSEARTGNAIER